MDDCPNTLKRVVIDEPECPFTEGQLETFESRFQNIPETIRSSIVMAQREQLWGYTLALFEEIIGGNNVGS